MMNISPFHLIISNLSTVKSFHFIHVLIRLSIIRKPILLFYALIEFYRIISHFVCSLSYWNAGKTKNEFLFYMLYVFMNYL